MNALLRRKAPESRAAGAALKHVRDAQSSFHDLLFAVEILSYLRGLGAGTDRELPAAAQGALMSQSILLYVRATGPSGQRKSLKLLQGYNEAQRELHEKLVKLRNKVIAHLDYDRSFGSKSFADEALVLVHNGDGTHRLQVADMRVIYQHGVEEELFELLLSIIPLCERSLEERAADAARHIGDLSKTDPDIQSLIERHPFDAVEFFGNQASADAFLNHGWVGAMGARAPLRFSDWPHADRGSPPSKGA